MTTAADIDGRFLCRAEERAARQGRTLKYDDIGDRLMALRKEAWDRYDLRALWNRRGDATLNAMRGVARALRLYGDLEAAHLAAAILREVERQSGDAAR